MRSLLLVSALGALFACSPSGRNPNSGDDVVDASTGVDGPTPECYAPGIRIDAMNGALIDDWRVSAP